MASKSYHDRLARARSETIEHEIVDTDPLTVRVENHTPNSDADRTMHIVVVLDDAFISSSPDFQYRDIEADKYILYLFDQDEDPLLAERVSDTLSRLGIDAGADDEERDEADTRPAQRPDEDSESETSTTDEDPFTKLVETAT
jgi:hypothetical protein